MAQAKYGDRVRVHYTGKLDDGTIFDTSENRDPLEFTIGGGKLIPAFEEAVDGMSEGEMKTTRIPSEKAYGPHHAEMVMPVDRDKFPEHIQLQVGQPLQIHQSDGQVILVMVMEISDESVTLDANHPLAGQDLTFDIELVEIL